MDRFLKLSCILSVFALIALAGAGVGVAIAEPGDPGPAQLRLTQHPGSCQAAPSSARDGAHADALADVRARLGATQPEEDVIPLNGAGFNYRSDARVSNELLFMDAELQRQ